MEQEPNRELQDATIEEMMAACSDKLPAENLEDLSAMEPEEAYSYLIVCLPEFGVDDPFLYLEEKGVILSSALLSAEKLAEHQGEYRADEVDRR